MHVCSCDVLCEIGLKVEWGNLKHANIQSRKLETLRHPKIEPHCLQMNLKYQIWTCVKLLRWNKTPIWPWESRAHSPANRFWPCVHSKLEMKLILNWESFDTQLNKNWIWSECDLKSELNLTWLWFEFGMIVIWIWNDCELNWVWSWIWSEFEVNLNEIRSFRLWVWAPSHHVHILTTECSLISLLHAYRLSKSLQ